MQVPKRKSGKYTNLKTDPHITQAKFDELKNILEKLKKVSRPRAIEESKRLAEMGDFSENAAYSMAKGRLRAINEQILELQDQLKNARIINLDKNIETVQLGHKVTIATEGKQKTYLILGSAETNPTKGIISHHSPIGSALMGRSIGDKVKIQQADKAVEYEIVNIE
jgi:transcription elongation factor GreA